jgi:heat shock protein HslJ
LNAATRAALSLCLVAMCGCSGSRAEEEVPAGNWLLPGTSWRLVELDGEPFAGSVVATLTEDGRIVGQAPCNRFMAEWTGRWPDLSFSPAAVTRMACPDLAAEQAFLAALGSVDRAALDADGLVLGGSGRSLRFVREP